MKAILATLCVVLCIGSIYATDSTLFQSSNCNQCTCTGIDNYWMATLLPVEEVPKVNGSATAIGSLILSLETINSTSNPPATSSGNSTGAPPPTSNNSTEVDNLALRYHLFVKGNNFNAAHIHIGQRCVSGPVVAFLAGPFPGNGTSLPTGGILAEGLITSANLTGPLAGFTIFDLVEEIKVGNAYANVHSVRFPSGETRGQIHSLQEDTFVASDLLNATICTGMFDNFLQLVALNATGGTTLTNTTSTNATNIQASLEDALSSSTLAGNGPFTVFAPTDEVWSLTVTQNATNNTQAFLNRHVVSGAYTFADFLGRVTVLRTLGGTNLTVDGVQPNQTSTSLLLKAAHHPPVV